MTIAKYNIDKISNHQTIALTGGFIAFRRLAPMPTTSVQQNITLKLSQQYQPTHLEVINESDNHNVPPGSESHFKVIIVCNGFNDHTLIQRHRMINDTLADELKNQIHALALHTYTQADWDKKQKTAPVSPECLGGGK